ncbi:TMhelix containing protein [Vibrio phage 1.115.B._10N.222.49.B11]|nr:TMhelix containing protein [Vibrio phage 1.115.A._10N.222.49.B11]AUR88571.1 TMhelix containing protein [Vibrio phage 1.115.B._10N.222.49.B11]
MIDLMTVLGGIAGAAILALSALLKVARNGKKLAEKERDIAEAKVNGVEKRIEAHEKREEIEQDIAMGDHPYVDGMRDPYDRDSRS